MSACVIYLGPKASLDTARRVNFGKANGRVPANRQVISLCQSAWCVNPVHLALKAKEAKP